MYFRKLTLPIKVLRLFNWNRRKTHVFDQMIQHSVYRVFQSPQVDLVFHFISAILRATCSSARNPSQNSTTRCSAQNLSIPRCREINAQCPPCNGASNRIHGFLSAPIAKNETYGTNGSSSATINSTGTPNCPITFFALDRS